MTSMFSFTEQEWMELEYEALTDQMSRHMASETPEIQAQLTEEHAAITDAYNAMVEHGHQMKDRGEWENLENDIAFGDFPTNEIVHNLWDEHEMLYDMNAFEGDVNAQNTLASKGYGSAVKTEVTISTYGKKYATGESDMGKVFIPMRLVDYFRGESKQCSVAYNGCEDARSCVGIRMPWKCLYVCPK